MGRGPRTPEPVGRNSDRHLTHGCDDDCIPSETEWKTTTPGIQIRESSKLMALSSPEPTVGKSRKKNRLADETSPYLLQHASNPVDWFPWGEESLARAKAEDKPIFLSIGYSACHWCHVMERESFENPEIAALMNEHFINIKVDREERPD